MLLLSAKCLSWTDGKSPYERRFGEPFKGLVIPFGAMFEYYPISSRDLSRLNQIGKKVLPGVFLGHALFARRTWKGVWSQILQSWRRWTRQKSILEDSMQEKYRCHKREENSDSQWQVVQQNCQEETTNSENLLQGESGESQPEEAKDDADARADFWSIQGDFIYRHHIEPRVELYVPKEETFPIPLRNIDVTKSTHTDLDVLQEKCIDDCCNVDANRSLSDSWKGFTKFASSKEKPPKRYVWSG